MAVLEDVLKELKEEKGLMERHVIQMPNSEKSRITGWYEGQVKAYEHMIEFVEKYLVKKS